MEFLFIGVGLFTVCCTFFKPRIYWESRKALRMRKFIGDFLTSVIYYLIGFALIVVGVLKVFNVITLY